MELECWKSGSSRYIVFGLVVGVLGDISQLAVRNDKAGFGGGCRPVGREADRATAREELPTFVGSTVLVQAEQRREELMIVVSGEEKSSLRADAMAPYIHFADHAAQTPASTSAPRRKTRAPLSTEREQHTALPEPVHPCVETTNVWSFRAGRCLVSPLPRRRGSVRAARSRRATATHGGVRLLLGEALGYCQSYSRTPPDADG